MKLGLINSAWAQAGRDTAFGIRMTKEIGFDAIDVFADPLDTDEQERRLILEECRNAGLPIESRKGSSSRATSRPSFAAYWPIDRTQVAPAAHCSAGGMTSFCQRYSPRTSRRFWASYS